MLIYYLIKAKEPIGDPSPWLSAHASGKTNRLTRLKDFLLLFGRQKVEDKKQV
jgi:hypothetical protein